MDRGGTARLLFGPDLRDRQGMDIHILTGFEEAGGPLHRNGGGLRSPGNPDRLCQASPGSEGQDRGRRNGSEKLGKEDPGHLLDELGKMIGEPLVENGGEKGHPLQKALHVRVGGGLTQHGRNRRMGRRELPGQDPESRQLDFIGRRGHG